MFVSLMAIAIASQNAPVQAKEAPKRPRQRCHVEPATGSRLTRNRICITDAEKDKEQDDTFKTLDDARAVQLQQNQSPR